MASIDLDALSIDPDAWADFLDGMRPAWHRDAACREHVAEANLWFPERGEPSEPAKRICAGCLVRVECAADALDQCQFTVGIWGGLSGRQRRELHHAGIDGEKLRGMPVAAAEQLLYGDTRAA
ncbi:MAG: WhiB family transcriptional regulator [Actinomycetota bacterium]|nr:WhiB family transcriptional regulator [Actinomycetota bacterium]